MSLGYTHWITSNDYHHSSNNFGGGGWHTVSMDQAARSGTRVIPRQAQAAGPRKAVVFARYANGCLELCGSKVDLL